MMILTGVPNFDEAMIDILKIIGLLFVTLFIVYTIPRLITFAIFSSYYDAKVKFFENTLKKARQLNETERNESKDAK